VDRCALFVDAGYVLGDGAMAVHGTRNRESVSWDYGGVLHVLQNVARDHTGLPLLRCYWYEATMEGRRSAEHNTLADLPGVKLRLGRMRPGHREGVESEIHRDLTTLARNRAISHALVVSAEEDLAQVIAEVQDLGIRVTLVHIGAPGWTAPAVLRQECDDIVEISEAHLRPSVELVVGAEPVSEEEWQAAYASRALANGHGPPGVIGQPQPPSAGSHAAPPAIYTGAVIAEYQRAAQPPNSEPAAANASGPLGAGPSRTGENGLAGLAPGGPGLAAPPLPAPPPPAPLPPAPARGIAAPAGPRPQQAGPHGPVAPPGPVPGAGPAGTTGSRDTSGPPTLPQPGVMSQPGVAPQPAPGSRPGLPPGPPPQAGALSQPGAAGQMPSGRAGPSAMPSQHVAAGHHVAPAQPAMPPAQPVLPPGQLAQGQAMPNASVPAPGPAPLPQRQQPGRAGGQHAGPPAPQTGPAPGAAGQHAQHAPPPQQLAPGQPMPPGQPAPGQPMPAYQAAPPPPAAPLPPAAAPAAPAAPAQPGFRGQVPDVAAARQAAAAPRPPTVGAPPGPSLAAPPSAVPGAPAVQPGQPLQPGQPGQQLQPHPPGQQPRGYPAGLPGRVASGPAGQQARQFPVAPAQPEAGVTAPYAPQQGPHSGPQPAAQHDLVPQPVAVALADAVQAAHGEGFSFGQAVARDAPALWLEAVLARKPRMPSDLEARLLQDSSLPIDSLLHDEVRHALRRGFWDALERVRH
jgi:hypothetical protein